MEPMILLALAAVSGLVLIGGGMLTLAIIVGLRRRSGPSEPETVPQTNNAPPQPAAMPAPRPDSAHAQVLRRSELLPTKPPTGLRPSEVATPKLNDGREDEDRRLTAPMRRGGDIDPEDLVPTPRGAPPRKEEDDSDAATVAYRLEDRPDNSGPGEFTPLQPDESRQRKRYHR